MTHDITPARMDYLKRFFGKIGVEGDPENTEIIVRIKLSLANAEEIYYELGKLE